MKFEERMTEMTAAAITPSMKRRLEELAAAEQRTESQIVRFAITAYLESGRFRLWSGQGEGEAIDTSNKKEVTL